QLGFGRRHHDIGQVRPVHLRITRVAAADVEFEHVARVLTHVQHQLELFLRVPLHVFFIHEVGDRLAPPKNFSLLVRGPQHVERRAAWKDRGDRPAYRDETENLFVFSPQKTADGGVTIGTSFTHGHHPRSLAGRSWAATFNSSRSYCN